MQLQWSIGNAPRTRINTSEARVDMEWRIEYIVLGLVRQTQSGAEIKVVRFEEGKDGESEGESNVTYRCRARFDCFEVMLISPVQ